MAHETEKDGPLARRRIAPQGRDLPLPDFPALTFRTALPEGMEWFESDETVTDFRDSGVFSSFRRLWLGYDPAERDRLEISVYCARIPAERVALASDYARLMAMVWGPLNYGVEADDRDFGEVLTGEDKSGFDRRLRISVWRRGTDVLILCARTMLEYFEQQSPAMAALVGSLEFVAPAEDPVIASLIAHRQTLPSGAVATCHLPPHWQLWNGDTPTGGPIEAQIYLDRADAGGNSALGLFGIAVPSNAPPGEAPLRDIATAMSGVLLKNLAPDTEYALNPISQDRMKGFDGVATQALFLDRVEVEGSRPMGASGFFLRLPRDVLGLSALGAYPLDQEGMGLMIHANFVIRLVIDDWRDQFGQGVAQ